ncbi:cell filamentation protein [[Clostridium] innocuum]|nr:cell filamentation protein [[Clostridium] innocuum]
MVDKDDYLLAMECSLKKGVELKYLLKAAHTDKSYDQEVYRKGIDTSYYCEGYTI